MASAEIPREELAQSIKELIKGADLSKLTSKIIRQKLGDKYGLDFIDRKKEIDQLLMKALDEAENENGKDESESEKSGNSGSDSEFEEPEDMGPPVKKVKQNKTITKKPARKSSDDSPMDDEELAKQLQEEENGTSRRTRTFKNPKPVKQKKPKKEKTEGGTGRKGKGLYGQEMELSPILAEVMGKDKMVRSDIVKRMWEIIKERDLADPKNRQFMKCDDQMQKLFGRKRVKTFGMMKYLKDHIFKPGELAELTTS